MILTSWNGHNINDGTNYEAILNASVYGLPVIKPQMGLRQGQWPLIAGIDRPGKQIVFEIYIRGSSVGTLQKQLAQWFDPDDEEPKQLIGQDAGGGNSRYIMGICQSLDEIPFGAGLRFIVVIQIHGDVFWRETTPTSASSWSITATGQTKVVANNGEMDAYPILTIKPTSAKTGSWPYRKFFGIQWNVLQAASNYPVDITNGLDTRIASTNFALASGDDLRVWVDGVEVDRWLVNPDTSATHVWTNLDFIANIPMTLAISMNNSITEMTVNESIVGMPDQGIVFVNSEFMTYTSKSNASKTFYGLERGAKGSTAASHVATATVFWIQHDIWILYGNAGAGSPPADAGKQPLFVLSSSSNTSWYFTDFYEIAEPARSAAWQRGTRSGSPAFYGGNQGSNADPAVEAGIRIDDNGDSGVTWISNPCGITNANFMTGERYQMISTWYFGWGGPGIYSSVTTGIPTVLEYTIPDPAAAMTWESWSRSEALITNSKSVGLGFVPTAGYPTGVNAYLESSTVTLTLNSSYTPGVQVGTELTNYSLSCDIWNLTTLKRISLELTMSLNAELILNTDAKTVLAAGLNKFGALTIQGDPRRDWLKLQPGNNTLRFDDPNTNAVTIDIDWEERFYQ